MSFEVRFQNDYWTKIRFSKFWDDVCVTWRPDDSCFCHRQITVMINCMFACYYQLKIAWNIKKTLPARSRPNYCFLYFILPATGWTDFWDRYNFEYILIISWILSIFNYSLRCMVWLLSSIEQKYEKMERTCPWFILPYFFVHHL